jgi:N-acetyl-gamma-glutamyl-phosphate reductase
MLTETRRRRVGILHGAGYAARDLITLVLQHPALELTAVTSESQAGAPIADAHPRLRGVATGDFLAGDEFDPGATDVIFSCGHHGAFMDEIVGFDRDDYAGVIVDLSANFRLRDRTGYPRYYDFEHPHPELLSRFVYGLPERNGDELVGARRIANPGCFAAGIALSLAPLSDHFDGLSADVVALTGASGAGMTAKSSTHFPERDGNVRAYSVWSHRHMPEIEQSLTHAIDISLAPGGGPWVYGIWGIIHVSGVPPRTDLARIFDGAYADRRLIRLLPDELPELKDAARTPFCDIGWKQRGDGRVVIGFALDNLLKGAASNAIQNANLALGLPETLGLLPHTSVPNLIAD